MGQYRPHQAVSALSLTIDPTSHFAPRDEYAIFDPDGWKCPESGHGVTGNLCRLCGDRIDLMCPLASHFDAKVTCYSCDESLTADPIHFNTGRSSCAQPVQEETIATLIDGVNTDTARHICLSSSFSNVGSCHYFPELQLDAPIYVSASPAVATNRLVPHQISPAISVSTSSICSERCCFISSDSFTSHPVHSPVSIPNTADTCAAAWQPEKFTALPQ